MPLIQTLPAKFTCFVFKMDFIMAIRAYYEEIVFGVIFMIFVYMMSFKNIWYFTIFAYRTFSKILSFNNIRGTYFIYMVFPLNFCPTFSRAIFDTVLFCQKVFFAKLAFSFLRPFSSTFKLAFSATAMLFRTRRYSIERFSANFTVFRIFGNYLMLSPSHRWLSAFKATMNGLFSEGVFTYRTYFNRGNCFHNWRIA